MFDRNSEKSLKPEKDLTEIQQKNVDISDFKLFLKLFKSDSSIINEEYRERFLNIKWSEIEKESAYSTCIADKILFQNENFIGAVYEINCLAGGYCKTIHLAVFNTCGTLHETLRIGYNYSDLTSETMMSFELHHKNKLKLKSESKELNHDGEVIDSGKDEQVLSLEKYMK